MLELCVEPGLGSPGQTVGENEPGLEVWRDAEGRVCAYGGRRDRAYWLRVPSVGEYILEPGRGPVIAAAEPGVAHADVEEAFRRIVTPLAMQALGDEVMHASASLTPTGVVGFCGTSGAGKSSLAYALTRKGLPVFADDALVVRTAGRAVEVSAPPFRLSLREPTARFFGLAPGLQGEGARSEPAPLRGLVVLERAKVRSYEITSLSPADAFPALLEHAYCFTLSQPERTRAMVASYLEIASGIPVLRLRFAPSLEELPALAQALLDALPGSQ